MRRGISPCKNVLMKSLYFIIFICFMKYVCVYYLSVKHRKPECIYIVLVVSIVSWYVGVKGSRLIAPLPTSKCLHQVQDCYMAGVLFVLL